MAENTVIRESTIQGTFECIDLINALADEGALVKQILIDIRDSLRIGINAGFAAAQARIQSLVARRETHRHPWLQDAIPDNNQICGAVKPCTIKRMRHGANELPRRIARQLRVRVQGDHVLDVFQIGCRTDND